MHTSSYEFLMKPKESVRCPQTLGFGDETTSTRLLQVKCVVLLNEYDSKLNHVLELALKLLIA